MSLRTQSTKQAKLVCVGYGNMARAILEGLIKSKAFQKYEILIVGRDLSKAKNLCDTLAHPHIKPLFADSHTTLDIQDAEVLLCVKPHALRAFTYIGEAHIVYSVMAGVRIATLTETLKARNMVRIMPNIGALYGKSANCVYVQSHADEDSKTIESAVYRLVNSFGNCVMVSNESLIDASIATSGSTPAFLALVAQSLIDSGIYHGLNYEQSKELVAQTFEAFATLLQHKNPDDIKIAVTSPSGTTARGLATLEKCGVRGAFIEAGITAVNRAKELGDT